MNDSVVDCSTVVGSSVVNDSVVDCSAVVGSSVVNVSVVVNGSEL